MSANFFATLGARPAAGRFFLPEEDGTPIAPTVIVLAHGFWQRQFQGSASAVGRPLTIGDADYTIVGVAPEGFTGVANTAVDGWIPLTAGATPQDIEGWSRSRLAYWLRIVGRLRPGGQGRDRRRPQLDQLLARRLADGEPRVAQLPDQVGRRLVLGGALGPRLRAGDGEEREGEQDQGRAHGRPPEDGLSLPSNPARPL